MRLSSRVAENKSRMVIPSFGFMGEMASGKNTYADRLRDRMHEDLGISPLRVSFSSKIIEIATDLFGMEGKDRHYLGEVGSKMREIDPAVWANCVIREIERNGSPPFLADGLRFSFDDAQMRQKFPEFLVVRITADEAQRMEAYKRTYGRYPTKSELNNRGEGDMENIREDITLFNDYSDGNREEQLGRIVASIKDGSIAGLLRS